ILYAYVHHFFSFTTLIHTVFSSSHYLVLHFYLFFFFNDPATTEIYTLSLHDALPISNYAVQLAGPRDGAALEVDRVCAGSFESLDRKSTRLNSSHVSISYAVFCLKKKKQKNKQIQTIKIIQALT